MFPTPKEYLLTCYDHTDKRVEREEGQECLLPPPPEDHDRDERGPVIPRKGERERVLVSEVKFLVSR